MLIGGQLSLYKIPADTEWRDLKPDHRVLAASCAALTHPRYIYRAEYFQDIIFSYGRGLDS